MALQVPRKLRLRWCVEGEGWVMVVSSGTEVENVE